MSKINVLIEVQLQQGREEAFALHSLAANSENESLNQAESLVSDLAGYGLEVMGDFPPVPLFREEVITGQNQFEGFAAFASPHENPDVPAESFVVSAVVERARLEELKTRAYLRVYPNSELTLYEAQTEAHLFDLANSRGGVDCNPFKTPVTIEIIRELLGVEAIWRDGFRGQNIVVGIIDEGVNGDEYPVIGGYSGVSSRPPGAASIQSHGSMCAADILVAAPAAKLYDYPFLGVPNSGTVIQMFQDVLNQRRLNGTPHITNNSYGFVSVPTKEDRPDHEVWDINHPLHKVIRNVVASGAPTFFAAGNCGASCAASRCHSSSIGSGKSIHGANSISEVITVAAVNSFHERIGYSSQGPGMFDANKPDIAAYSHFFGNFGPGRPAGGDSYDNGTSASSPVAAGVAALLMSAFSELMSEPINQQKIPSIIKEALIKGAINIGVPGWDTDTGHGVINAATSYAHLKRRLF